MNNQEQQNRQNKGGSGSAENMGQSRKEQLHHPTSLSDQEKQDIADDIGGNVPVAGLKDLGAMSGRDDSAGGSGDNMENQSTAKGTKKF